MSEFTKAANILNALKAVTRSEHSHPFMASLYAPLVAADLSESSKIKREGGGLRRAILPGLAGGALAIMMAQHLARPAMSYMQNKGLTNVSGIGKHLLQGARDFLSKKE